MMGKQASTGSWIAAVVVVLGVVVAGVFLARKALHPSPSVSSAPASAPANSTHVSPAIAPIEHPISQADAGPANAATTALPALDGSDEGVASALATLAGSDELSALLLRPQIVARIVATIDTLLRHELGSRMLPLRSPNGRFLAHDVDGQIVMDEQNGARYAPYMQIVDKADPQAVVAWYVHNYALFQHAYQQLGYPNGYFNDRLVKVIDDLLATPESAQSAALVRAKGGYVYADPALESLSSGQRLLLRIGPDNETAIKAKLRAIRSLLAGQNLHPASTATAR
ncbi:MAG: DUF3014 domain-containing protein [Rhodanobacter sp.]